MNWFLVVYVVALTFISYQNFAGSQRSVRMAWLWLAAIPFSHFVMSLFRAGNLRQPGEMLEIQIWSAGFEWLFLGLSMVCVARIFGPR